MDLMAEQELIKKIEAYKTICEDLIMENKSLREKIHEYENSAV